MLDVFLSGKGEYYRLGTASVLNWESAHPNGILLADASPYLPDGFLCWMFATAGVSVGRFYKMGT